jgi:hypothetical protein
MYQDNSCIALKTVTGVQNIKAAEMGAKENEAAAFFKF